MTEKLAEQLSAVMDNECTEHEFALALRRLGKERDMLAYWERCHLISDVLKGHAPDLMTTGFAGRVADLIAQEQVHHAIETQRTVRTRAPSAWIRPVGAKPLAGLALAASVAGVVLFTLPLNDTGQETTTVALQTTSEARSPDQDNRAEKLNTYLANHNELATLSGIHGVMPYVKMVNYHASR